MMPRPRSSRRAALATLCAAACAGLSACGAASTPSADAPLASAETAAQPAVPAALMSSLPLYWPLGAAMGDVLTGAAGVPWQRTAIEQAYTLTPLDTLSPMPGLGPDTPETDPLAGHSRLAIIQPRGLSPADNVALDTWVRAGGRLLLALDPALTGDYDLPLGDPRRPSDGALIPAVVARWGLAVQFDDTQEPAPRAQTLGKAALPLVLAGSITIADPAAAQCTLLAGGAAAQCAVGKGRVTLIADAALFEHPELAGESGAALAAVLAEAWK